MRKPYKVQVTGNGQFRVAIPKVWARKHGLSKGDTLYVEFFDDNPVLRIFPKDVVRKPDVKVS